MTTVAGGLSPAVFDEEFDVSGIAMPAQYRMARWHASMAAYSRRGPPRLPGFNDSVQEFQGRAAAVPRYYSDAVIAKTHRRPPGMRSSHSQSKREEMITAPWGNRESNPRRLPAPRISGGYQSIGSISIQACLQTCLHKLV